MNDGELKRRFQFYSAVHDIVQIWGETEIGNCEVDEDAIAEYCMSLKFATDHYSCWTKEDIYQKITDDILEGFPVWRYLKLSDWTKEMIEKAFANEQQKEWLKLCKQYKCYTCKYHQMKNTGIGAFQECTWEPPRDGNFSSRRYWLKRREFTPKKSCAKYESK